jgi:hypothetical protein
VKFRISAPDGLFQKLERELATPNSRSVSLKAAAKRCALPRGSAKIRARVILTARRVAMTFQITI